MSEIKFVFYKGNEWRKKASEIEDQNQQIKPPVFQNDLVLPVKRECLRECWQHMNFYVVGWVLEFELT